MVGLAQVGCGSNAPEAAGRAQGEQALQQLRESNQQLQALRTENQDLPRLRKDNKELHRLRQITDGLPQLREENGHLRAQLQALKPAKSRP